MTLVKNAAGTVGWLSTMTCPNASFMVSQLHKLTEFYERARKIVDKSIDRALKYAAVGICAYASQQNGAVNFVHRCLFGFFSGKQH